MLERHAPHLVSGQQQDCQEFLAFLLDSLHEDMNRVNRGKVLGESSKKQPPQEVVAPNDREAFSDEAQELRASEAWRDHLLSHRSLIVDLFQGQLRSTLKCLKCKQVSIKFDCFMYLSVPIP